MADFERIKDSAYDDELVYVLGGSIGGDPTNPTKHDFEIRSTKNDSLLSSIHFHRGALENGIVNGILNESLLLILISRILSFQKSKMKCRENEFALQHLYEALFWLRMRHAKSQGADKESSK